jgi:hypothetical protein
VKKIILFLLIILFSFSFSNAVQPKIKTDTIKVYIKLKILHKDTLRLPDTLIIARTFKDKIIVKQDTLRKPYNSLKRGHK